MGEEGDAEEARWQPSVLTVVGLAMALLFAGFFGLPGEGETREWRLYLLLGTVFPSLLTGIAFLARRPGATWVAPLDRLFGALGALAALVLAARTLAPGAVWISVWCTAGLALVDVRAPVQPGARPVEPWWKEMASHAAVVLAILGAAHVFVRVAWWREYGDLRPYHSLGGLALAAGLTVFVATVLLREPPRVWGRPWKVAMVALPAVLFALAALRLPAFTIHGAFHHWGVFVGPANLVRGGGLLLWDVPAQYGVLSTLCIAWFPGVSAWEALRLLNAFAVFGSAIGVFGVVFALRPGPGGMVLGTGLAVVGVYLLPDSTWDMIGPFAFPSTTAFRFGAAYVGLAATAYEARLTWGIQDPTPAQRRAPLFVGSALWVLCAMWSIEGAVYATATWLPAVAWSRYGLARRFEPGIGATGAVQRSAAAVGLPLGMLGVVVLLAKAWYHFVHGVPLDLSGYSEYATSFTEGFATLPIVVWGRKDESGYGVTSLFVVFLLLSTALAQALGDPKGLGRQVVGLAAWGAVWSTASYFVSRSHPNNSVILIPIMLAAVGLVWLGWSRARVAMDPVIQWVTVAWFVTLLFEMTEDPARLVPFAKALRADPTATALSRMPLPPQALVDMMADAGVRPDDRIVYANRDLLTAYGTSEQAPTRDGVEFPSLSWLPIVPLGGTSPLTVERKVTYMQRYAARHHEGGWYVQPLRYVRRGDARWLTMKVDKDFEATKVYQCREWRLEWRAPKPPRPSWPPPWVDEVLRTKADAESPTP